ncbi:TerB family tellurite resistance protein [Alisedimentitalea sp. MJ-SS2]|uniref:tellurite resistance TerB family protein n=1 Tax=Aliisedimentitalea sp. MJ-SS2 TaxID=3049795 RepID=UPI00290E1DD4|nr:TerB family tellurite resistance protein [Alisedimentitalea sp. MJ-SS2]MDU8926423.1 TerB family tellurite resistance protein [Alisedimentitalea sp. MJ-SS2]
MPIVQRILSAFSAPKPEPLPEPDAKLALGALMVRVAKSDDSYRVEEIQRIDRTLARANGIGPIEAAKMRATCERLEALAPDTKSFAALIRETVSHEGRLDTLRALWQVLQADGLERPEELSVINATCAALGLSEDDNAAARAAASVPKD